MGTAVGRRCVMSSLAALAMPFPASGQAAPYLRPDDTLGTLLDNPAFAGFAPLLLPWDDRRYDRAMPLSAMASLMPYHSHVDPAGAVAALNRMIGDVNAGRRVFLDIYDAEQKQADPAKARTGLFFFCGKPGAPFAVIAPGGGFSYVGSLHEGFPYAAAIVAAGYNAFVVRYRPGLGERGATEDMATALGMLLRQAAALGVDTAGYSLWGSSAGARMAANIGSLGMAAYGSAAVPGPAAVVMAYTAHSGRSNREPPTFALVGERDGIALPAAMQRRIDALRQAGTPGEFHVYPGLGHGFGLGSGTAAVGWCAAAIQFWQANAHRTPTRPVPPTTRTDNGAPSVVSVILCFGVEN